MKTSPPMLIFAIAPFIYTVSCLSHSDSADGPASISEVTFSLKPDGEVRRVPSHTHSAVPSDKEVTNVPPPGLSLDDVVSLTHHQVSSSQSTSETEPSSVTFQDQGEDRVSRDTTPVVGALNGDSSDECYNDTFDSLSNFAKDVDTDYVDGINDLPFKEVFSTTVKYDDPNVPEDAVEGIYGGYYRDYHLTENGNLHPFETTVAYLHGHYREPTENYYDNYNHNRSDKSTLGYYICLGLKDLYAQKRLAPFYWINHYQYLEDPHKPERYTSDRPELQTEYVPPEVSSECKMEARALCPENTEAFCYRNGTIVCMSRMAAMRVCDSYPEMSCVDTAVPCAPDSTKLCVGNLETISMPCLTKLVIEVPRSGVLIRVAQTFVVVPPPPEEDRSYCVSIIFEPIATQYDN